jgi:hypothetical protein
MAVLRDILDGFFPSQLRKEFPDGVPIKLVDRTAESYRDALAGAAKPQGGAVGNVRTFHDLEAGANEAAGAPMSRAEFLARLPQAVIK